MRSGTWDHKGNYDPNKNSTALVCTDILLSFSPELKTFWVHLFPFLMQTCIVSGTNAWFRELFTTWRTKGMRIDMSREITYGQQCLEFLVSLHLSPFSVWCCPISEHSIAIWNTVTPGHHKWKIINVVKYRRCSGRTIWLKPLIFFFFFFIF